METFALQVPGASELTVETIVELEAISALSLWEKIAYTELGIMVGMALEAVLRLFT